MLLNNKGSQRPQFCGDINNIIRNLKGYAEVQLLFFISAEKSTLIGTTQR